MIKLVVSDLDGTLLDDKKQLPPSFKEVYNLLRDKGITWVFASGRQYYTMADQFGDYLPDIYLLAENGSMVMKGNQLIHIDPLDEVLVPELIRRGREVNDAWPILCCQNSAYVEDDHEPLLKEARKYYKKLEMTDDLAKVDDKALKFTLCDFISSEENSYHHYKDLQDKCRVAVAGEIWLDMTNKSATKGNALKYIMQHCHVTPDEIIVFGDYLNDMEMLKLTPNSYAMKNSHPDLFEAAAHVTRFDNNEHGVVKVLEEYFKL